MICASDIRTLIASGLFEQPCSVAIHGCSLVTVNAICRILLDPRVGQLICEGDCQYIYRPLHSGWTITAGASGARLPRVRPRIGEIYRPAMLTLPRLRALRRKSPPGELDMDGLLASLNHELSRALSGAIDVEKTPDPAGADGLFAAGADLFAAVEADLRRLQLGWWRPEGRVYIRWHAAVRALIPALRAAYGMMAAVQRSRFDDILDRGYLSAFAAMPDVTAAMLLAFRDAGALRLEAQTPEAGFDFVLSDDAENRSFSGALTDLRRSLVGG